MVVAVPAQTYAAIGAIPTLKYMRCAVEAEGPFFFLGVLWAARRGRSQVAAKQTKVEPGHHARHVA